MNDIKDVTAIITTYANSDFTNACVWALRRYYPDLRIIFADGHPTEPFNPGWWDSVPNTSLVWAPGACTEDCRNAAVGLVDTPLTLFMDNDAKVIGPEALPLCLEVFNKFDSVAATGWYGLVVDGDHSSRRAWVGTEFTDHMPLSATQATFSLHSTEAYRSVHGMPKTPFYDGVPEELWKNVKLPSYTGDFSICRTYLEAGFRVMSPKKTLPILHWTQAVAWMHGSKAAGPFDTWWLANTYHTRVAPLNNIITHVDRLGGPK